MRIIYIDTSVLVSTFFDDQGDCFLETLESADRIVSSILVESEFLSVICREKSDLKAGIEYLKQVSVIIPERSLVEELKLIYSNSYVRGADAFHLACALYLDPSASKISFLTADKAQQKAASLLGF